MSVWSSAMGNLKTGFSKPALKEMAWVIGGAISYAVVPTVVEACFSKTDTAGNKLLRVDMTGWKGVFLGLGTTVIGGMAAGKPGFALGGLGAATVHIAFARLNDYVVYPILGKHLFRFDPKALDAMGDDMPSLPQGARQVDVGGKSITVLDRDAVSQGETAAMMGYSTTLMPQPNRALQGYGDGLNQPVMPSMGGYAPGLNPAPGMGSYATNGLAPQASRPVLAGYGEGLNAQAPRPLGDRMGAARRLTRNSHN